MADDTQKARSSLVSKALSISGNTYGKIRSVRDEACARIYESTQSLKAIIKSARSETMSNAFFFAAAVYVGMHDVQMAFAGAAAVYAPLIARGIRLKRNISRLEERNELYDAFPYSSTYDDVGLSFRGNRPLAPVDPPPEIHKRSEILTPLMVWTDKGLLSSALKLRHDLKDIGLFITFPARNGFTISKRVLLGDKIGDDFLYSHDEDDKKPYPSRVIITRLKTGNENALVVMPAHLDRLKKSLSYTQGTEKVDYAERGAYAVGTVGALEFCKTVVQDYGHRFNELYSEPSLFTGGIMALWIGATIVGLKPLQHSLDHSEPAHEKSKAIREIVQVKRGALRVLKRTKKDIERSVAQYQEHDDYGLPDGLEQQRAKIEDLLLKIDPTCLEEETQIFLVENNFLDPGQTTLFLKTDDIIYEGSYAHAPS